MSIIQEALKKIEKPVEFHEEKRPEKDAPAAEAKKPAPHAESAGPKYIYYAITALLLILLAGIVLRVSYTPRQNAPYTSTKKVEPILPKIERREEPQRPIRRKENIGGFVLNGIMQLVDGPRAIINDIIVGEGETISGAKVEKIKKDGVLLKYNDSEVALDINR
jgi:hypothetical protein